MAPAVDIISQSVVFDTASTDISLRKGNYSRYIREPLKYSGALDKYKSFDVTPTIGREFPDVQLTDLLNNDQTLRDLAITVSRRGVVFFRNQDINSDQQKVLGQKLGELTGKPATSKLHRHAVNNSKRNITVNEGKLDDEISVISSEINRKLYGDRFKSSSHHLASEGWHADITFENVPSDYAILKITDSPEDNPGGDTLWASGYEVYDRLSSPIQQLADTLKAVHYQPRFNQIAKEHGIDLIEGDRGAPENTGYEFKATHPLVRTNPVTGWKSLFGAAHQVEHGWIEGVTPRESEILKQYFNQLIAENHDLQVRFKWNTNDVAIWDNRSVFHTATNDYKGKRQGNRVVSLGEIPYYDLASTSRRVALEAELGAF
ncbi:TfdA family taurine dioxygenase, putative [Talaromyces stipitatus ATCC 10500]|uniref:TfdA family taurine dioxygenase, putative n=1 Tax=Talaromyces stipitatus (strain ATCC 10500 / CBS 375.48 / QM 6759 / NRRL 1006) TaxID=441959 RepID=B8LUY6_TALSN|nr:TfdA family taurine dioxygenase, putative [Talaromyces stipitatus ATCC 10500]EED22607.1 TfdA family taurine dioxygenase, putative [Talaromyces stipitatus ATCC 10500]